MYTYYQDILSRISDPPLWFDEAGVPRFVEFAPTRVWNIYAREALLLEIQCQGCGRPLQVAMSHIRPGASRPTLAESIRQDQSVHYGDPPNIGCCAAGPTMNSIPIRVLQFWNHGNVGLNAAMAHIGRGSTEEECRLALKAVDEVTRAGWDRLAELEIAVKPPWE